MRNVKVVAVHDKNERRLKTVSKQYNIPRAYNDLSQFLEEEKLDFVDICTPEFTHYEICMESMDHGLNILVEKPIALSLDEVTKMEQKRKKEGVKVCVVQNYRFKDPIAKAMKMYEGKKIGRLEEVVGVHHGLADSRVWREKESGGILYSLGIHIIDLQTYFCGEHDKILGFYKHFDEKLGCTTLVDAIIRYKNGSIGILDLRWLSSSNVFHFNIYGTACNIHTRWSPEYFYMSSGPFDALSLLKELLSEVKTSFRHAKIKLLKKTKEFETYSHFRLISEYIGTIENDREPPISINGVMNTMKLLEDLKTHVCNNSEEKSGLLK